MLLCNWMEGGISITNKQTTWRREAIYVGHQWFSASVNNVSIRLSIKWQNSPHNQMISLVNSCSHVRWNLYSELYSLFKLQRGGATHIIWYSKLNNYVYDIMNNVKLHRCTNCVFYVLPMLLALKYTQSILTCHFSLTSL